MIWSSIQKIKFTKKVLAKDKDQNNESETNSQNKVISDMDSALVKYKDKTRPSEATEETKKIKNPKRIRINESI